VAADIISRRALAPVFDGNQKSALRLRFKLRRKVPVRFEQQFRSLVVPIEPDFGTILKFMLLRRALGKLSFCGHLKMD